MRTYEDILLENIYFDEILNEGRADRYYQMFPKEVFDNETLPTNLRKFVKSYIDNTINWSLKTLKKDDKVVHNLLWGRISLVDSMINHITRLDDSREDLDNSNLKEFLTKYQNKLLRKLKLNSYPSLDNIVGTGNYNNQMEHFMTQGLEIYDDYVFDKYKSPKQILDELEAIERKYFEGTENSIIPEEDDEIIINFDDEYAWWNTHEPVCTTKEAKIMQHCGNQYHHQNSGDEVFSLRKLFDKKRNLWEPKLTFIVNNGIIRESKGKQNEKPDVDKYGKYIFELLKSDHIYGFDQYDSHDPKNNFYIDDLPEEWLEDNPFGDKDQEHFHDNGRRPNLDIQIEKIYNHHIDDIQNLDVNYGIYDDGYVDAYAHGSVTVKLPSPLLESNDIDNVFVEILESIFTYIDFDSYGDDTYYYDEDTKELTLYINSRIEHSYYGDMEYSFDNFMRNMGDLDQSIENFDTDDLIERLIEKDLLETEFNKIGLSFNGEFDKYEHYDENDFPETDFFMSQYEEGEMYFYGNLELHNLKEFGIDEDDSVLVQTRSSSTRYWSDSALETLRQLNHPIYDIHRIMMYSIGHFNLSIKGDFYQLGVQHRENQDLMNFDISYKIEYDSENDNYDNYVNQYKKIYDIDQAYADVQNKLDKDFKELGIKYEIDEKNYSPNKSSMSFKGTKYKQNPKIEAYIEQIKKEAESKKISQEEDPRQEKFSFGESKTISFKKFFTE